jgi:hypothetical protein
MKARKRPRSQSHPQSPQPRRRRPKGRSAHPPVQIGAAAEGRVVAVDAERGTARVMLDEGGHVDARLPQHVSVPWLAAAVELAAVEAAVTIPRSGRAILWSVFPSAEHAAVSVDVQLVGRHVTLEASEQLELRCSRGSVSIDPQGNVTVRGKDVLSRASGANRIKGGIIGLN